MKKFFLLIVLLAFHNSVLALTIPNAPPFVTSAAYSNVLVNMSVETPMGGAAYADQAGNPVGCTGRINQGGGEVGACYFSVQTYLGIFDPNKCYVYSDTTEQFNPVSITTNHQCGSGWSGNFLNWATMTAAGMFVWTMTGGDREVDSSTNTVLQQVRVQNNISWFPIKYLANPAGAAPFTGGIYITNHNQGGYVFKVGTTRDGDQNGRFNVKVKVCDPDIGLEENCKGYTSGTNTIYKPEGLIQRYADKLRFGVMAYTNDNAQSRDGGVLRAPMRYVGESIMDSAGELSVNTEKEINPDTGQIYVNPLSLAGGRSGVINYINRFHRDGYKSHDPVSELFYESIRYFKNLGPTPEYASGAAAGSFPIYTTWNDPQQFSCQKNFMVAINDANPWLDKKLPGTYFTCARAGSTGLPDSFLAGDCGEPSNPDTSINVSTLTNTVGTLEGLHTNWIQNNTTGTDSVGYVRSVNSNVGNCNNGKDVTVSNLSRIMGSCPSPGKENSYYISGLAYYANTTDLRSDFEGKQTVNTFMIDTQEYSSNPLSGNRNMLYLAGKYGGFNDLNNNNKPDLRSEWDEDEDNQPDNYVFASAPIDLVLGLEKAFNNILTKSGAASNVTANSTQLSTNSAVYQAEFNSGTWHGDLFAYPVSSAGVGDTYIWSGAENIPLPADRKIFTTSSGGKEFVWANLSVDDKTALGSSDVLDYIRGVRSKEVQNGGGYRNRFHVLGDIVHSSPYLVKDTNTVYVGSNDGMLHAFNAENGVELFSYIPSAVIPKLNKLTKLSYTHDYYVDGDIVVSSREQTPGYNYLVSTLGHGGKGLFGLNVSTPDNFSVTNITWEYFSASDADLGFMLGRPVVAKMNDGSIAVIVGNGYNSTSGKAVLYIFDLVTGSLKRKIDTLVSGDNGLATPGIFDSDNDGDIDYIYAGDLKGNLWKFDVTDSEVDNWKSAFLNEAIPEPLFVAKDPSNNLQPITAQITVSVNDLAGDPNIGKRFIFFGTGSYFRSGDPSDINIQSWYGLIDEGVKISDLTDFRQRTILEQGTLNGFAVRSFSSATEGDMAGKKGWYINFLKPDNTANGERIVSSSKVYKLSQSTLIASSIIPIVDPCLPGGNGYVNAINPYTGGSLTIGFFDINGNSNFSDDKLPDSNNIIGSIDLKVNMPSEPIIIGDRLVVGGTSGNIEDIRINPGTIVNKGRISWREILQD